MKKRLMQPEVDSDAGCKTTMDEVEHYTEQHNADIKKAEQAP